MLNSDGVADGMVVRFSAGEFEGDFYVGEFHDGNYDGMGVYIWAEGHKYLGRYENGDRQGAGITLNADGSIRQTSDGKKMVGNWDKDKFSAETRTNDDGSYGSEDTFLIKYEEEDKRWEVQRKLGELVLVYDNGGILVTCNAGWVTVMGISRQVGIGTDRTPIRGSYYEVYDFDGNFIETRQL
jgi:hypothetical protein